MKALVNGQLGHPDEKSFYFCGKIFIKRFFHIVNYTFLYALSTQKVKKKEVVTDKDEVPEFIEKKIQSRLN